jgi:hypothetical protein
MHSFGLLLGGPLVTATWSNTYMSKSDAKRDALVSCTTELTNGRLPFQRVHKKLSNFLSKSRRKEAKQIQEIKPCKNTGKRCFGETEVKEQNDEDDDNDEEEQLFNKNTPIQQTNFNFNSSIELSSSEDMEQE